MTNSLEKVTLFITRQHEHGHDLLLFQHPFAGIQIPAGTVEEGETPESAAQREAAEETGLSSLTIRQYLSCQDTELGPDQAVIRTPTTVYARPDATSFDWARLPRGVRVTLSRSMGGFAQVNYEELDRLPNPQYSSLLIVGWVPEDDLTSTVRRHFFLMEYLGDTADRWTVSTDYHRFTLFWSPLTALPPIIPPQDRWLDVLRPPTV